MITFCMIGLHNWNKWTDPTENMRQDQFFNKYYVMIQYRCCADCHKMQSRKV